MSNALAFEKQEVQPILLQAILFTVTLIFITYYGQELLFDQLIPDAILFFTGSLFAVFMHEAGHKFVAHLVKYRATITTSKGGLITSAVVLFYTFARIPLLIGNPIEVDADTRKRLGKHRQYDDAKQFGLIAFGGVLASTIAIATILIFYQLTGIQQLWYLALVAGIHAISSLIPWELFTVFFLKFMRNIPETVPGDGLLLLRWHFLAWIFALAYIISFVVLALAGSTTAFATALAAGLITIIIFSVVLE